MFGQPQNRLIYPLLCIFLVLSTTKIMAQTSGQWGNCEFENTTSLNNYDPGNDAWACKIAFVSDSNAHYRWNGSAWVLVSVDIDNIYQTNGTISGDRTLTGNLNSLVFQGLDSMVIEGLNLEANATNNLKFFADNTIEFELDATDGKGVYIDSTGNIGVGTSSPDAKLDIEGGSLRLSDYGAGSKTGAETYYLGVQSDGDVVEIDLSIDSHDDVDISSSPPGTGDMLVWDGTNFVPESTDNGYTIFGVWAEEAQSLANNSYEWSFGNGDNTPNGQGIVIPVDCELFAMSLNHEGGANTTVRIVKGTNASLSDYQVSNTGVTNGYNTFASPLAFGAGDVVNFTTISVSAQGTSGRVTAWFRIRSTPASTSLLNDLLDVSAGSISNGDILYFNGSSFVPLTLNAANIPYDNSTSGLSASNTQDAIDELATSSASGSSFGSVYVNNNGSDTPLSTNTPAKANAPTTFASSSNNVDSPTSNRLRYTGSGSKTFFVSCTMSTWCATKDKLVHYFIYKNGSPVAGLEISTNTHHNDDVDEPITHAISGLVTLSNNEYIELWIENKDNGADVTIQYMNMTMMSLN